MNPTFIEEVKRSVKNWWVSLILGILYVCVALFLLFYPVESYGALTIVFSICMFASGILEIFFSLSNRSALPGWGWYFACGIIDVILGLFLIYYPGVAALTIPFILSFWIMFRGFSAIGFSIDMNRFGTRGWGWYLVFGILAIICSFIILWSPGVGAFASVYMLAFAFMFIGIFRIMLSADLHHLYKDNQELKEKLKEWEKAVDDL